MNVFSRLFACSLLLLLAAAFAHAAAPESPVTGPAPSVAQFAASKFPAEIAALRDGGQPRADVISKLAALGYKIAAAGPDGIGFYNQDKHLIVVGFIDSKEVLYEVGLFDGCDTAKLLLNQEFSDPGTGRYQFNQGEYTAVAAAKSVETSVLIAQFMRDKDGGCAFAVGKVAAVVTPAQLAKIFDTSTATSGGDTSL